MKRKSKFLTILFGLFPGAGHMYLGLMNRGLQLMVAFWGLMGIGGFLNLGFLLFLLPVIWCYAFFEILNLYDLTPEEREARIANDTIFDGRLYDAGKRFFHNHTRGIGIALILVGLYSVLARIFSPLFYILEERYGSFWGYYLQEMVPTLVVALLVILLGVRLIRGKSTPKDDKDFKDYKGEDIDD